MVRVRVGVRVRVRVYSIGLGLGLGDPFACILKRRRNVGRVIAGSVIEGGGCVMLEYGEC